MALSSRFAASVGKVLSGETTCTIRSTGDATTGTVDFDEFGAPIHEPGKTVSDGVAILEDIPCVVGEAPDRERTEATGDVATVEIMLFRYVPKELIGRSREAVVTDADGVETTYNIVDVNHDPLNTITVLAANTTTT